jgi:hypothetical protein
VSAYALTNDYAAGAAHFVRRYARLVQKDSGRSSFGRHAFRLAEDVWPDLPRRFQRLIYSAMPTGRCRLCLQTAELQDSHFWPAAVYGLLRLPDKNPVIVSVHTGKAVQTSEQVTGFLFCCVCEDRLNSGGERWVMGHCWRTDSEFPLRDTLWARRPVAEYPNGTAAFDGNATPGVSVAKLAYFGCSIFWRATLAGWRQRGSLAFCRLDLGRYEEQLRQFLLGVADFPQYTALIVTVTNYRLPMPLSGYGHAPHETRRTPYHQYRFVLLGITFDLLVGSGIPEGMRNACTLRSGLIYTSPDMDTINMSAMMRSMAKVKPVGALRTRPD